MHGVQLFLYNDSLMCRIAVIKYMEERALQRVYEEHVKVPPGAENLIKAAGARHEDPARVRRLHARDQLRQS